MTLVHSPDEAAVANITIRDSVVRRTDSAVRGAVNATSELRNLSDSTSGVDGKISSIVSNCSSWLVDWLTLARFRIELKPVSATETLKRIRPCALLAKDVALMTNDFASLGLTVETSETLHFVQVVTIECSDHVRELVLWNLVFWLFSEDAVLVLVQPRVWETSNALEVIASQTILRACLALKFNLSF
jgi:hypothetical protein